MTTVALDPRSPWFPIAYSATLVRAGEPRVENIPYHVWLYWLAHVEVQPQSQPEALAVVQSCIQ